MVFKNLIVNGILYPQENCQKLTLVDTYENVDFDDSDFITELIDNKENMEAVELLSLCHSISVENG